MAITVRPQYYQAKASTYVRTYTCTCVPNCHYTADNDGQIGYRGYATPRQGKVANAGIERNVWDICTRGVGEMDEDERERGRGRERDGWRNVRGQRVDEVREKERGPLKITSYTLCSKPTI